MPDISQSNFLQAMGWAVLNSLWQMALLWIVFRIILSFASGLRPDKKTGLATGLLVTGFGWFLYTFISLLFSSSASNPISSLAVEMVDKKTWTSWTEIILPVASVVYLLLLVFPLWQFARNYRYVQQIRQQGLLKTDPEWRMFVKRMAARMGINKNVGIWLSELVSSPVTVGYLKPIILIPVAAINHLNTQQVEAIILHELSHIRRFDYLFNLIINFIKTVLYFNPFVRLFVSTVEKERENSCDEMVIQFQYKPYDYASALLLLEKDNTGSHEMMIAANGHKNDLLQRIENILGVKHKEIFSFRRFTGSLAVLLSVFIMNAFLFISKQPEGKIFLGFNNAYNPYYFLSGGKKQPLEEVKTKPVTPGNMFAANTQTGMKKETGQANKNNKNDDAGLFDFTINDSPDHGFYNVNYTEPVVPELAPEEENKVKETLEATKKVMQESQWKQLENNYAEILNSAEKAKLKTDFKLELNKIDWNKVENQLRYSYNAIDWNKVNNQLATSLAQIKLDSIQHVISATLTDLVKLETWMKENKTTCIPDTDISLQTVKADQQKVKAHLDKVRAIKEKKVVRL